MKINLIIRNSMQYFLKSGFWGILEQLVAFLRAIVYLLEIIVTKLLFDSVTISNNFQTIKFNLLLFILLILTQQILNGLGQFLFSKVSYTNMGKFMVDFQKKLGRVPAIYFENPEFLDKVERAKESLEYESIGHFASICLQVISYYLVYLLGILIYLFRLAPLLTLIILLAFIPTIITQMLKAKYFINLDETLLPYKRRYKVYKNSIVNIKYYKETRILGAYKYFYNLFINSINIMIDKEWKTEKKMAYLQIFLNMISFSGFGLSIYILFSQTMSKTISIGMFMALFVALSDIFVIIDELISSHISEGTKILGQVYNFYNLMDLKEIDINEKKEPDFSKGIIAKNIEFSYKENDRIILNNINLEIKPKETIAFVGVNGSGKSTLVKLLIGFYAPKKGYLSIGGIEIKNDFVSRNYKNISSVFQNFQKYKLTLRDNVCISDFSKKDDIDKIKVALEKSRFNSSKATLETVLSSEFGGIDLSGGLWQRLAISRGIFRENEFIVLDEPTASIDPIEEEKLYQQFQKIIKDCCSIIVTHRLGSTKFADRIVVLDKGKIIEIGTHDELLEKKGKYYSMWEAQSKWYNYEK